MRGKSNHTAGHLKVGKQAFWYLDWDKGCRSHSPGSAWVKGMGAPRGVIDREQKERQLMVPCAAEGCMSKDLLYVCQLRILVNGVHPNSHASCWSGLLPTKNDWNLFFPCFPPFFLPPFLPSSFLPSTTKKFRELTPWARIGKLYLSYHVPNLKNKWDIVSTFKDLPGRCVNSAGKQCDTIW